jgi:hypothetical protein
MDIGMLWFDGDKTRDIPARIERAAEYYQSKYGQIPNLCYLNPLTAGEDDLPVLEKLEVRTSMSVLRDHFWIGIRKPDDLQSQVHSAAA